jgi:hypothetical protein
MRPQQKLPQNRNKQRLPRNHLQFRRNRQRAVVKRTAVVKMKFQRVIVIRFVFCFYYISGDYADAAKTRACLWIQLAIE